MNEMASGTSTTSSTSPSSGIVSGSRSTGDSTYRTISATAGFSQPGASGCRSANHSSRASPRITDHRTDSRFHIVGTPSLGIHQAESVT